MVLFTELKESVLMFPHARILSLSLQSLSSLLSMKGSQRHGGAVVTTVASQLGPFWAEFARSLSVCVVNMHIVSVMDWRQARCIFLLLSNLDMVQLPPPQKGKSGGHQKMIE